MRFACGDNVFPQRVFGSGACCFASAQVVLVCDVLPLLVMKIVVYNVPVMLSWAVSWFRNHNLWTAVGGQWV